MYVECVCACWCLLACTGVLAGWSVGMRRGISVVFLMFVIRYYHKRPGSNPRHAPLCSSSFLSSSSSSSSSNNNETKTAGENKSDARGGKEKLSRPRSHCDPFVPSGYSSRNSRNRRFKQQMFGGGLTSEIILQTRQLDVDVRTKSRIFGTKRL